MEAGWFTEGLARVCVRDLWGYVDLTGALRIEPRFEHANQFRGGRAVVREAGRYGFIDAWGKWVRPPTLRTAGPYKCGRARANESDEKPRYGYLDSAGGWAVEPRFRTAEDFSDGLAFVTDETFAGFIDVAGRPAVTFDKRWKSYRFSEGLAAVREAPDKKGVARMGYIGLSGEPVIPFSFDSAGGFSGGFATVRVGEKWGIIDRTGHYAVPPTYDDAPYDFSDGLAPVREGGRYRFIDPGGTPAFGGKTFAQADPFINGGARVGV